MSKGGCSWEITAVVSPPAGWVRYKLYHGNQRGVFLIWYLALILSSSRFEIGILSGNYLQYLRAASFKELWVLKNIVYVFIMIFNYNYVKIYS